MASSTAALLAGCTSGTGNGVDTAAPSLRPQQSRVASIPADAIRPAGTPQVNAQWASCAAAFPATATLPSPYRIPRFDPSFKAVTVIVCTESRAGGSGAATMREQRSDNVAPVLDALQLPDLPPLDSTVCSGEGEIPLNLVLLDAQGRWIRPGLPGDVACGKTRPEIRQALQHSGLA
ncbi:hypothetical protein [Actinoplanes siamensis]|uniref:Uncharacterized protein n=1 Tax=Actinoplanes siamensis TaxID=1223317 RepID=A0A919TPL0_9ACTN|nr:hypothetical protein [Actinoplanes siamensis]GIF08980.1 hypothetical protein Asi03nite_65180 [Actinoplanes siamensis]